MKNNVKRKNYEQTIISNHQYFEASATEPENVDVIFKTLLTNITKNENLIDKILMENQSEKIKLSATGAKRSTTFKSYEDNDEEGARCEC